MTHPPKDNRTDLSRLHLSRQSTGLPNDSAATAKVRLRVRSAVTRLTLAAMLLAVIAFVLHEDRRSNAAHPGDSLPSLVRVPQDAVVVDPSLCDVHEPKTPPKPTRDPETLRAEEERRNAIRVASADKVEGAWRRHCEELQDPIQLEECLTVLLSGQRVWDRQAAANRLWGGSHAILRAGQLPRVLRLVPELIRKETDAEVLGYYSTFLAMNEDVTNLAIAWRCVNELEPGARKEFAETLGTRLNQRRPSRNTTLAEWAAERDVAVAELRQMADLLRTIELEDADASVVNAAKSVLDRCAGVETEWDSPPQEVEHIGD